MCEGWEWQREIRRLLDCCISYGQSERPIVIISNYTQTLDGGGFVPNAIPLALDEGTSINKGKNSSTRSTI